MAESGGTFRTFGPLDVPDFPSRMVRVFIPSGIRKNQRRPVLYMFDGQNVFGDEGSFAGGWHAHQAVAALDGRRYHVPIVVGVDHGNERRIDELGPWRAGRVGGGGADRFLDWMISTVVPLVARELPAQEGPVGAVVAGSSMGGLAALYAHYRNPEVFGGAIAMSPALFVGRGKIYEYLKERPKPIISRVYVDGGGREGGARYLSAIQRIAEQLEPKGYDKKHLLYRLDQRGEHNERAWRRRLPRALRFMFKR